MDFDSDHVNGRRAAVARVVEGIATHGDSCAVGVLLLQVIVDTATCVRDVAFVIVWNVFAVDENDDAKQWQTQGCCAKVITYL